MYQKPNRKMLLKGRVLTFIIFYLYSAFLLKSFGYDEMGFGLIFIFVFHLFRLLVGGEHIEMRARWMIMIIEALLCGLFITFMNWVTSLF